jgi:hypothetical protein
MAYYAYLNENNIVTGVISGKDETEGGVDWEAYYGALRTSFNTHGGVHYGQDGKPDGKPQFRKNYAGIGYFYDPILDGFIPPKPYPSWSLNETTCLWEPPVPIPDNENAYQWNEETQSWVLIPPP